MMQIVPSINLAASMSLANLHLVPELFLVLGFTLLVLFFAANFVVLGMVFRSLLCSIRALSAKPLLAKHPKGKISYQTPLFFGNHAKRSPFSFGVDRMGSTFVHGIPLKTTDHLARRA